MELPLAKDFANERNESLLSNCRVQLILSKGRRRDSKKNISFSKYSFVSIILIFKNSDAKVKT